MSGKKGDSTWRKRFEQRRAIFLNALRGAVAGFPQVVCRPVDDNFGFGWQFEQGDERFPSQPEGGLDYAESYCRHMIGQGLCVAFVVAYAPTEAAVWLRAWEPDDKKPRWPSTIRPAMECVWRPVRDRSELLG